MKQRKKKNPCRVFFLIILSTLTVHAQSGLFKQNNFTNLYTAAGIGGGTAHYIGDLTTPYANGLLYIPYTNVRWNATAYYTKYFTPQFGTKVSFTWARLFGSDFNFAQRNLDKFQDLFIRNLHFRNDVKEFAISGIWNLKYDDRKNQQLRPKFMPYFSAGIGFISHDPKAKAPIDFTTGSARVSKEWVSLKQFHTSGQGLSGSTVKNYSSIVPVIPLAFGFRMRLTEKIDLSFEGGYRITTTDYLDDVGRVSYPDLTTLASNYGTDAANFSYRAGENYDAVTGALRIPQFIQVWSNLGGPIVTGLSPSSNATGIYDPTDPDISRGSGSRRVYHRFDSYLVTQFTISYVISDLIKCPPIK